MGLHIDLADRTGSSVSLERRTMLKGACGILGGYSMRALAEKLPGGSASGAFEWVARVDKRRILSAAHSYLSLVPKTITSVRSDRSAGGLHDFFSEADYFWPDPAHPDGPYVNRDGQSNPANFNDHRKLMIALSIQMPALTAAWLLSRDKRYSRHAADHLHAWFVAPETRMNPNLEYAQAVHGVSTGRSYGIIDTLHLVEVARAASILEREILPRSDAQAVRNWFASYLEWLSSSERGKAERDARNNHAMCWALQAAEFARLVNDETARLDIYRRYREVLLPDQMAPDGSFPKELTRTKPYSYSIFNFDVMAALCQSLKGLEPDPPQFHLPDGRGLAKAADFLYPYLKDKREWKWARDVEHFDALPVRSPGLLFAGLATHEQRFLDLWMTLNPDPTDSEVIRNYPIRQPVLWV